MRGGGVVRAFGALLAVGLLLAAVLLSGLQGEGSDVRGSVHNAGGDGWMGLHFTLQELGLAPEVWQGSLEDLPAGRHALWWGRAPAPEADLEPRNEPAPDAQRGPDPLAAWRAQSPDAPRLLRRFLVQGGRLVAPTTAATVEWLAREAGLTELEGARVEGRARTAGPARGPGGEGFELGRTYVNDLVGLAPDVPHEVLLADADGAPLVIEVGVGRGSVVFLPREDLFDNGVLRDGGTALFAVRLAESLAPGGRLLFDEGVGGRGVTPELGGLLAGPALRLASLHALALALLALWLALAPGEFRREPRRGERVSALERARARAGLALRARRPSVLAAALRAGVLRRAARRLRVRPLGAEPAAELAALRAAAPGRLADPRWERAITRAVADDPADLAALDAELRALESELAAPHDGRARVPFVPSDRELPTS